MFQIRTATAFIAMAALASATAGAVADETYDRGERGSRVVEAPTTRVETRPGDTDVRVRAPYTGVHVDTERRRVRIRVPYFNRDIRW